MFPETARQEESGDETVTVVDLTQDDDEKLTKVAPDDPNKDADEPADKKAGADDPLEATDDDDEDAPVSGRKDFSKRLKREIRQKTQARAEAATERQAREAAEQRAAEAEERARQAEERLNVRREPDTSAVDAKITQAEADLAKAIEDGDTTAQVKAQSALSKHQAERLVIERQPPRQEQRPPQQRRQPQAQVSKTGQAFIAANQSWWNDPEMKPAKQAIIAIDNELIAQGSDPNSEAHYERIKKRAAKILPSLKVRQPFEDDDMSDEEVDLNDTPSRRRQEPPMGGRGSRNGDGRNTELRNARAGKITLTDKDKETMRTFKLDPGNPQHVRAFANSRRERILQEGERS